MRQALTGVLVAVAIAAGEAGAAERFTLTSPAFRAGASIPRAYTCDGSNRIVPLRWTGPPAGTRSFALVVDDPDAPSGTFTHRVAWAIGGAARSLPGRAPREGVNGAGRVGWVGPCPPSGSHRYVFTLYALRSPLPLAAGGDKRALVDALKGRVLAKATLVGRYARS
jgi:Raf kinase inhibitor-like YbhB/YbcL family protein